MRPIKLTMSAFASYSGVQEIDFTKLGTNGLYLITGDTGAGKTTIFDAIVYALYDEPSGNNRDKNMLRSKFAEDTTPTYVDLTFEYKGKEYQIYRSLKYATEKKRGTGTKTQQENAILRIGDEPPIDGKKKVDSAIIDIIGLDRNQFTQIVMLAQGDFLRLLFADSNEKRAIFGKIFKTGLYNQIIERIRNDRNAKNAELKTKCTILKQYVDNFNVSDVSALGNIPEKSAQGALNEEDLTTFELVLNEDKLTSEKLEVASAELQTKITAQEKLISKATDIATLQNNLKTNLADLAYRTEEIAKAVETLKLAEPLQAEADSHKAEAERIGATLPRYEELASYTNRQTTLTKACADSKSECARAQHALEVLKNKLDGCKAEEKELAPAETALVTAKHSLDNVSKSVQALNELKKSYAELSVMKKAFEKASAEHERAKQTVAELSCRYEGLYKQYILNQAGMLAEQLTYNEPCPVCGSTSHPKPAVKHSAVTEDELKQAKADLDNAVKVKDEKSTALNTASARLGTSSEVVINNARGLLSAPELELNTLDKVLEERLTALNTEGKTLSAQVKTLTEQSNRLILLRKAIPQYEADIQAKSESLNNLTQTHAKQSTELKEVSESIDRLQSELPFKSLSDARGKIDELLQLANSKKTRYEQAKKRLDELEKGKIEVDATINEQKRQLTALIEDNPDTDLVKLKAVLDELNSSLAKSKAEAKQANDRLALNTSTLDKIHSANTDLIDTQAQFEMLDPLYTTAVLGKSADDKIDLETYVQLAYFDKIVDKANIRFEQLVDGHYSLMRRQAHKSSDGGLDLDIKDHYANEIRDVHSLSGGEAFKASMALALGLSDVIQESSGGIRPDTMFIDEGFGSQDSASLDQAIHVLNELSESNILVGIISHVDTLKKVIGKQIRVTKDENGSSQATIVTDL